MFVVAVEQFFQKILLALLVGALLGLEREYSKKQEIMGLRTFSLVSLLAALLVIISKEYGSVLVVAGFVVVSLFSVYMYVTSVRRGFKPGFTTHISLILAFVLGTLAGMGLFVEAVFLSILTTIILFSRERLHSLVRHLTEREVGDLLEFLVLLGMVYPLLPEKIVVHGITVPLMMIWFFAVAVSLVNFGAFITARHFSAKQEIGLISFLGGLISSTVAVASLINFTKQNSRLRHAASAGFSVATAASSLRNFTIILIAVPLLSKQLAVPVIIGMGLLLALSFRTLSKGTTGRLHLMSPFNVPWAIKLGIAFLGLFVVLNVTQNLGSDIFFISAFLGGTLNSAAVAASAAGLFMTGSLPASSAGIAVLLASMGATVAEYVFCYINKAHEFFEGWWKVVISWAITISLFFVFSYFFPI